MKYNSSLLAGIALFASFCVIVSFDTLISFFGEYALWGVILLSALAFLAPAILLKKFAANRYPIRFRLERPMPVINFVGFTIKFSLMIAMLVLLINFLLQSWFGYDRTTLYPMIFSLQPELSLSYFLLCIVAPVVFECVFLYGAVFSLYENNAGTLVTVVAVGAAYALLHSDPISIIPMLILGLAYAYLTYISKSIIPTMLAGILCSLVYLVVNRISEVYTAFGVWDYLPWIFLLLLFLFAYLTFRSMEALLENHRLAIFQKNSHNPGTTILQIVMTPGCIAFILAYLLKMVFHII